MSRWLTGKIAPSAIPMSMAMTIHFVSEIRRRLASMIEASGVMRRRDAHGAQLGIAVPVYEVEGQSDRHPDGKTFPRAHRQPDHDIYAGQGAGDRDEPESLHAERPWARRIEIAKREDADADDGERGQRSDVREIVDLVFIEHQAAEGHDDAGDDRRDVRRAILGMDLRRPLGEQP